MSPSFCITSRCFDQSHQDKLPYCMVFADDIMLIDESLIRLNLKLNRGENFLETKVLRYVR